jgi:hypothetical protein
MLYFHLFRNPLADDGGRQMAGRREGFSAPESPRTSLRLVIAMLGMVALPAALTLLTVKGPATDNPAANLSPYGYTVSLLLFVVPILTIGFWLTPREDVKISKKACLRTLLLLVPMGLGLDFFFGRLFFTFPNPVRLCALPHRPSAAACRLKSTCFIARDSRLCC